MFLGKYRRIMILASALPIMQQLSGINTVVFYSSDVRHSACYLLSHLNFDCLDSIRALSIAAIQDSSVFTLHK